jgi:hypothetical protein
MLILVFFVGIDNVKDWGNKQEQQTEEEFDPADYYE